MIRTSCPVMYDSSKSEAKAWSMVSTAVGIWSAIQLLVSRALLA